MAAFARRWPGVVTLGLSLLIIFVWIPQDVESGLVEKVRRSVVLGDALAPTVAGLLIGLGGLLLILFPTARVADRCHDNTPKTAHQNDFRVTPAARPVIQSARYTMGLLALLTVSLALMRFAGPALVSLLASDAPVDAAVSAAVSGAVTEYRVLRDTAPWKYVGFVVGGVFMITTLISWLVGRFRVRHLGVAFGVVILLILLYDLPFDDLMLPPNGDV